jgi:ABC-type transport system involved in cytochrome c biogenesis ATPase subunit
MYTEILGAAVTIFEQRRNISKLLRKFRYKLLHGTLNVVIFGPGGAGKTTLGNLISGKLDIRKSNQKYIESPDIEYFKFANHISGELIIGPGQKRRATATWNNLYTKLAHGNSQGVINVVSYGFHSFTEIGWKDLRQYQKGMNKQTLINRYLKDSKNEELRVIKEITPRLKDAKKDIWMITLVTKQDLWWDERINVLDFYTKGLYNKYIEEISEYRGAKNFHHEYRSCSLVISNFFDGQNIILVNNTAGYDQSLQNANLEMFINTINSFSNKR